MERRQLFAEIALGTIRTSSAGVLGFRGTPKNESFTDAQQKLVATVVHNAGIYNGIIGGGLLWAAFSGQPGIDVARVMLAGAAVAGVFGTATLKSPLTALQAAVGIFGLFLV